MLTRFLHNLLPRAVHGLKGRFAPRHQLICALLGCGPKKCCQQKCWRYGSVLSHSPVGVGHGLMLQQLCRACVMGRVDTVSH